MRAGHSNVSLAIAAAFCLGVASFALAQTSVIASAGGGSVPGGLGSATIPASSYADTLDAGAKAHTNIQIIAAPVISGAKLQNAPGAPAIVGVKPQSSGPPFSGYFYQDPASIACIYNLRPQIPGCNPNVVTLNPSGGGRAIAVVDAYDDPNASADLAAFSAQFGVAPITPASFSVVFAPPGGSTPGSCTGSATRPPVDSTGGWEIEESLDIEWAHAMAPQAKLYLVEAQSNSNADLYCAVTTASNLVQAAGGGEVSMSWGGSEYPAETASDAVFTTPGVVYFASTGDSPGVIYPAASPNVVSVGGTTLSTSFTTGAFISENVWQQTGGGPSAYESQPAYQSGIAGIVGSHRGTPDIAADANPYTGVWVLDDFGCSGQCWYTVGGTSASTVLWAGMVNASNSFLASTSAELTQLYAQADFIGLNPGSCGPYMGYFGSAGWNFCTGLGSLINFTGQTPVISGLSPASAAVGTAVTISGTNFGATQGTSTVTFNGTVATPSSWSASSIVVQVPVGASNGPVVVTVGGVAGVASNGVAFTVLGAPSISSLNPSSATAGGPGFTLTVNGANFISSSIVEWDGAALSTAFVSATQLTALVPAGLIATVGTANITVLNPGGGASDPTVFTINPLIPAISGLNPFSATAGGPSFTLTVNGSNFVSGSTVEWAGTALSTAFVSATQLTASVSLSLITSAGTVNITVVNPVPASSAPSLFTILVPSGQTWTQLAPAGVPPSARAGTSAVFDATTQQMIIYGGGGPLGDLWSLSTGASPQWTSVTASGTAPSARVGHSAIYDSANTRMTIFGGGLGNSSPCANDVWTLTNATGVGGTPAWTQLNPTGALPPARIFHQSVYDPGSNRMIVFGGNNCFTAGAVFYNDVWVLTNANGLGGTPAWIQLAPTGALPAARENFSSVYDPASNRMIVFSGAGTANYASDVWILSNANGLGGTPSWTQLSPEGGAIPGRAGHTAVYDGALNRMVVFGGGSSSGVDLSDTWVLSNANGSGGTPAWTQLAPLGTIPHMREEHTAVFDSASNRMIVFGGDYGADIPLNDVWTLSSVNAPLQISVTIGNNGGGNCFPYSCGYSESLTEWQQHFAAAAFGVSGPISIKDFVVTSAAGYVGLSSDTGTFNVYLSTAVNALGNDSANLASNIGTDKVLFASVAFGPSMPASFTVTGISPFIYNPASGDLLIDVQFTGYSSLAAASFFNADNTGAYTLRNWTGSVYGTNTNAVGALVTQFDYTPVGASSPAISSLSPSSAAAGGPAFTLTVNGTNFVSGATVNFGGSALITTFVSTSQLTASVPSVSLQTSLSTVNVTVTNPNGLTSAPAHFTVLQPAISGLIPYSATAGGPAFTLTVSGSNFVSGCAVDWGAASLATTFVSTTQLTASVPAAQIATAGSASITVACTGQATSAAATFTTIVPSGQTWTQLAPTGGPPTARATQTAVFDPATAQMIVYSGIGSGGDLSDVWSLSTGSSPPQWTNITPAGTAPSARQGTSAIYDSTNSVMTIFGGGTGPTPYSLNSCTNDVWTLTSANGVGGTPAWTQLSPTGTPPSPRVYHDAVYDPVSNRMTVFGGGSCTGGFLNDVWVLTNANGLGGTPAWTQLAPTGASPAQRDAASAVYDPTSNGLIIFGGLGASDSIFDDIWILSDANGVGGTPAWTQLAPGGMPPAARYAHTAVYDSASNHMTIFGGAQSQAQAFNDTWVLSYANGSGGAPVWNQLAPAGTIPAPRAGHTAVLPPAPNQMIVFGGLGLSAYFNDVWTLSDSNGVFVTTSSVTPATTPANNPSATIAISGTNFNPGATVLFTPPGGTQTAITPSLIQAAQIAATIPSSLLTTSGTAQVAVTNASGVPSAALQFTISPLTISAVTPNNALPGSGATSITVNGQYFNSGAVVEWTRTGGTAVPIAPSLIQAAQLTATIPAYLLTTAGSVQIAISEPSGSLSNSLPFTVATGATISSLVPSTATAGGPAFTLNVVGTNFVSGCTVDFGATPLATTFVSTTQLTASVPAAQIATAGSSSITVACTGLATSAAATFTTIVPSGQTWTQLAPTGGPPAARLVQTAVYDPVTAKMIIYAGGASAATPQLLLSDIWSLSTGASPQWTNITPSGTAPAARRGASAIYDSSNSRMTIFGGLVSNGGSLSSVNEVWTLTNANGLGGTPAWTQLSPTGTAPPARAYHQSVYDPGSNRMIMFGGTSTAGFANDLWVLTNANGLGGTPAWVQLAPTGTLPAARYGSSSVYDPTSNTMIVFGGEGASLNVFNDVWILSNANGVGGTPVWTQLSPAGMLPAARCFQTMVYDSASNHLTMFGGEMVAGTSTLNDTWVLSNANGSGGPPVWSQLAPQGTIPAVRGGHTAVFAASIDQMIVFAGNNNGTVLNDVWTLSDTNGVFVTTSSVTPNTTPVNNPSASITIAGTNFNSSSTVLFTPPGGPQTALPTPSLVQAAQIAATIPSSLLTTSGTAQVAVTNASGVPSAALQFTISPLTISAVTPNNVLPGSGATSITVNGQYFNSAAVMKWTTPGGTTVTISPTTIQAAQLAATIPANLLSTAGTAQIAISDPNSTLSNSLPFAIQAQPVILSLSPSPVTAGGPAFTLTVNGSGFASGCTVNWNGTGIAGTAFVSAGQLNAPVTASQIAAAGSGAVTVTCGLLTSAPATLTILAPSGQTWTQLAPTGGPPSSRSTQTAVLDSVTAKMIIYAGFGSGGNSGDVWSLSTGANPPQWSNITPEGTAPAAREGPSAVYDSTNSRMTIFGGATSASCGNDVWTLTNANGVGGTPAWTQLNPTGSAPGGRSNHQAVYDPGSNRMIVFGGTNCLGGFYHDVWVLTNANGLGGTPAWMQLAPTGSPSMREASSAVYDPTSNTMIIFGGVTTSGSLNDVWALSDANGLGGTPAWTQLSPTGTLPPPRYFHTAVYDSASNHMTVFGGVGSPALSLFFNDTWVLSNANGSGGTPAWIQLAPLGTIPQARSGQTAVFTPASNQMIVFAGEEGATSYSNDVWTLSDTNSVISITSLIPGSVTAGSGGFTLTVNGGGFVPGSTVQWNATPLTTTFVSAAELTASVSGDLVASVGTSGVSVLNPSGATSAPATFTINVPPAPPSSPTPVSLMITSGDPGEFAAGAAVSASFTATGGTPPYSWSATGLPAGLNLNASTGALTGSVATPGNSSFPVSVSDSSVPKNGTRATVNIQILGITTSSSLTGATAMKPYSQSFAAAGGSGAYTFSASNAPAGLVFTGSTLSGTPSTAGTFGLQVTVADGTGVTASSSFTIVVAPGPVSITSSASVGEIAFGSSVADTLAATGGKPSYTWSSSSLPAGVTLNATSGALGGTPTQPGNYTFTVQVSDSQTTPSTATQSLTLQVLGITTSSTLPGATGLTAYSQTFAAAGGSGTYTFSASGAPAGLAFSGSALSGTPSTAGTFTFQVTVADGSGVTASASFTLVVAPGPLSITSSASVGEITFGSSVADNLAAVGGKLPYMWSSPGLPAGVTLNTSSGALGGSASSPGNYSFTVQVADAQTPPATANLTLTLQVLGLTTASRLPAGSVTSAYSQTFSAAGGAGTYTFALPNAPAGLSFSGATLSGTPNKVGTFSFTLSVTDAGGFTAASLFSLVVNGPATPLTVTGGPLPGGTIGTSYSQAVTGTGGLPPYTWAITGGSLPAGLSLDGPSGVISGTPSTAGMATFTAQATDGLMAMASGAFTLTIAPQPVTITGLPFPNGIVGSDYPLQVLSGSGGVAPYTFTPSSPTPVPGLNFSSTGQLSGTPTTAGTFNFTITTTDMETPPLTVTSPAQVTVSPAGAANLILSSASLSFNLTTGATGLPTPFSVTVQSSVVAQLLNYSVVTTPAVPWLDVTGGGATPGSIGIALDPSALNLGVSSLNASVVVTCLAPSPCAGMSQTIGVSLSVTAPSPQLTFNTNLVQFSTIASVTAPVSQQVAIQNIGGGSAAIASATAADSWLTVSNVPAAVPSGPPVNITFTADPTTLGPGFFRTTVTIGSTGGTITVPVTFNIAQSPTLTLSTTGTQFQSTLGSAPGNTSGSFQVGATGGTAVSFTAAVQPGAPWLVLSAGSSSGTASGSGSATVGYSIDPVAAAALSPAQAYYGTIAITASGVTNSPQDYEVVLNVAPPTSLVAPDPEPAGLLFQTVFGTAAPAPQTVTVYSSSPSPVTYSASASTSGGGPWLSVSPSTGSSSATAAASSTVTVTPGTLVPGVYTGTVSYQFSAAAVRSVNVTLIVEQPGGVTGSSGGITTSRVTPSDSATCTPSHLVPTQTGLVSNFAQPTSWPTPLSIVVVNDCGATVGNGQVVATFSNGDPPLALGLVNGGTGLYSGTWTPRTTSGQVTVTATATAPGFSASAAQITGQVVTNTAPLLAAGGTLHIYDPLVGAAIGAGTILQIYGSGLGASPAVATTVPLTTTINGTSVLIGGIRAPLYFVSSGQIDAQLPYELTPGNSYSVVVNANGQLSTPSTIQVTAATPGIAAYPSGQIVAQHADFSLVSEQSPAAPGEYLVIYLSGLGLTGVTVADGAAAPVPSNLQLLSPLIAPTVTLNGTSVPIYFSGLTPGYVGLYQMNFQVPPDTPNGDTQLVVTQAGTASNSTILPVHN